MAKQKKARTIREMADELYPDQAIADAVVDDAERLGTVKHIEAGVRFLPSPQDAIHWYTRQLAALAAKEQG